MDDVVCAMNHVQLPEVRQQVMTSLAAFGDRQYQQRVWMDRIYPRVGYYDDLTMDVHVLYDDCEVLPDPEASVEWTLLPGDEIERVRALDAVLGPLIDELGGASDSAYLADPRWVAVTTPAADAQCAMVLAGGWWTP